MSAVPASFGIYRLNPVLVRQMICSKLAWSVKQLYDSWPAQDFSCIEANAARWLTRLLNGNTDGCDFGLHHQLVRELLVDNYDKASELVTFAGRRMPRTAGDCISYGTAISNEENRIYDLIFSINDFDDGDLAVAPPDMASADRYREQLKQVYALIQDCSLQAFNELDAFKPVWLLASTRKGSKQSFGGYSTGLAWGTIALNVEHQDVIHIFCQVIHEMAHQLLFALSVETPLIFNHPSELFPSPIRTDQRPMDGVMHACFVSARMHDVLGQLQESDGWQSLRYTDQQLVLQQRHDCLEAAISSLKIIDEGARLSALGERIVHAIRQVVIHSA